MDLSEPGSPPGNLLNPHAIPITVKAVARFDGVPVRLENEFAPCERADQNEQRGLRQMEIREELIDHAKRVARLDENGGFGGSGFDPVPPRPPKRGMKCET